MRVNSSNPQWNSSFTERLSKPSSPLKTENYQATSSLSPFEAIQALTPWKEQEEQREKTNFRWYLDVLPLRVALSKPPSSLSLQATELQQLLSHALAQWQMASQEYLKFVLVTPSSETLADIQIYWSEQTTLGRDYEVGHTDRRVQGHWIRQATITLVAYPIIDRHLSSERQKQRLYSTFLHELGHALGLEHSGSERDVMHHRGWKNTLLSHNDIEQLQTLYQPVQSGIRYLI